MSSVEPMTNFQWAEKEPLKFRPFKPKYHITMALQNSSPSELIVMDCNYKDHILDRRQLMKQHPDIVVGAIPQGKAAVKELYTYLMSDYLPKRYPTMFSLSDDGKTFRNQVMETSFPTLPPDDPIEALRTLGETIEDDVFLLHETEKGHRSVAYVCCYCSGFDPSKKLDKLLDEIHAPVPSYDKIGPSMERFFSRVKVGKNAKRVNVSLCAAATTCGSTTEDGVMPCPGVSLFQPLIYDADLVSQQQWSVVDSPILFNCKGNHVHGDDIESVIEDEDIDISQVSPTSRGRASCTAH